jgi:transketolase
LDVTGSFANQEFTMVEEKLLRLHKTCIDVRRDIVSQVHFGGSGHVGGCLSCVEILTALFFAVMRLRPDEPGWPGRDRFVLSKGHAAPTLYAVLAERGYFPLEELKTFTQSGTRLQKHVDMHRLPGVDVSSGSLGQGLSISIGMALADRQDQKNRWVYAMIGDGECQEGQIWEAALAAAQFKLNRLILYLDHNCMQVDGFLKDIIEIEPIEAKWQSFGWQVQRIDGHAIDQILDATAFAHNTTGKPHMIICDTVKGKGISFMENKVEWHSHAINDNEYAQALAELALAEASLGL